MSTDNLIEVSQLSKIYRTGEIETFALKDISLSIPYGDFTAIMGASGSGKSTFMNMLGCLDKPTSGTYRLDGMNVFEKDNDQLAELRNKKIGFIFQSFNILPRTSALENVELPLLYNNYVTSKDRREKALHALQSVGLGDRIQAMPNELSGGQQQRVAIARALVNDALVIMADEPTGNLDSKTSYEIMDLFQKLNDNKITVVMVTHEPDIARFAKRNIVFKDGKIIADEKVTNRLNAAEELYKISLLSEDKATV